MIFLAILFLGVPKHVLKAFSNGFPENWQSLIEESSSDEGRRSEKNRFLQSSCFVPSAIYLGG